MKITLEVIAGEGGKDSKLLASDQAFIYAKYAKRSGCEVLTSPS